LGIGVAVAAGAVALAFGLDVALDTRWSWQTLAIVLLALGAFGILVTLSSPGLDPPGVGFGVDAQEAYMELLGREAAGTVSDYRPPSGGFDALVAMLPPALTFAALVSKFGVG
jgi:hypothetical protein